MARGAPRVHPDPAEPPCGYGHRVHVRPTPPPGGPLPRGGGEGVTVLTWIMQAVCLLALVAIATITTLTVLELRDELRDDERDPWA